VNWFVSTSQIDLLGTCEARWGFNYISKIREPQAASAMLGTELHNIAEAYLQDGKAPDELTKAGDLFVRGLPFLPPPGSGGVEGEFRFELGGIRYLSRIDYRGEKVPGWEGQRVTLDHKTSSNPKGEWCMPDCRGHHTQADRQKWLTNSQSVLYGTYDMLAAGDEKSNLRWLYYRTKGSPIAIPRDITLSRAELEDCFEEVVHAPATRILELISAQPDPNTLDKNTGSCKKYGKVCINHPSVGGRCQISTQQKVAGALLSIRKKDQTPMSQQTALEKIRRRKLAAAGGAASSAAPKTDVINPPEKDEPEVVETAAEVVETAAPKVRAARAPKAAPANDGTMGDEELGRAVRLVIAAGGVIQFGKS